MDESLKISKLVHKFAFLQHFLQFLRSTMKIFRSTFEDLYEIVAGGLVRSDYASLIEDSLSES